MNDVKIARIIRPTLLAVLTLFFIGITIASSLGYTPDQYLLNILRDLLMLAYAFYFVGRSIEKSILYINTNAKSEDKRE